VCDEADGSRVKYAEYGPKAHDREEYQEAIDQYRNLGICKVTTGENTMVRFNIYEVDYDIEPSNSKHANITSYPKDLINTIEVINQFNTIPVTE
ncbi:hypothetical protein BGZ80_008879, partial [Entomortierella chlamydospora]